MWFSLKNMIEKYKTFVVKCIYIPQKPCYDSTGGRWLGFPTQDVSFSRGNMRKIMGKVVLVLVDGLRPDGFLACGNPVAKELIAESAYDLHAETVYPSVTLPCHMSLFHSVPPERHGITTNLYTPQVRPVPGLCEQLRGAGKRTAFFYSWEELRDLCRPDGLCYAGFVNKHVKVGADAMLTAAAIDCLKRESPDFLFLYLGETDDTGHRYGWMGEEYLRCVSRALDCANQVRSVLSEEDTLILMADHGGHGRMHGENIAEDMTIPVLISSKIFQSGERSGVKITDIAPTVAKLLGVSPAEDWEGHSLR